jgi:DNA-binding response OmpR family regulator
MRVLLVESSKAQSQFFGDIFYANRADIVNATTGHEALDIIKEGEHFDVICSSVVLSDMKGSELCSLLRANPKTLTTPIIMVTAGSEEVTSICLAAGATDVFSKMDIDPLRHYIQSFSRYLMTKHDEQWKILYVEDSKSTAHQTMVWLDEIAASCDHFEAAEEALEAYKTNKYDLLITDVLLKGHMSGLRLARQIREQENDDLLPILVISGFSDVSRILEVYRAGVDDYVLKPQAKHDFLARVANLIGKHHPKIPQQNAS